MNLSQVEYFEKAAETLSFTRAADELFVTQQAVSKAVASLEEELGAKLFVREVGGLTLTPAGELARERGRALLGDARLLATCAHDVAPGAEGRRLRLAVADVIVGDDYFLRLDALLAFERRSPGTRLEVIEGTSDACLDMVRDGRADVALVFGRADRDGLVSQLLRGEDFALFTARSHPLAGKAYVSAEDLAAQEFLIPRGASESVRAVREGLFDAGAEMPPRSQFQHPDCTPGMLIQLVYQSAKVGLIVRKNAGLIDAERGAVLNSPPGLVRLSLTMAVRETSRSDAIVHRLRRYLSELLAHA